MSEEGVGDVWDDEVWVRLVTQSVTPLEPWHLATAQGTANVTICGITFEEETEEHAGIPELSMHGGKGGDKQVNLCTACYQIHLARLGYEISDAPISEDYEPLSIPADHARVLGTQDLATRTALHPRSAFRDFLEQGTSPIGPVPEDSPIAKQECPACFRPIGTGRYAVLLPLGPGASPDERRKAAAGEVYNAVASFLHWSCMTGLEESFAQAFAEFMERDRSAQSSDA